MARVTSATTQQIITLYKQGKKICEISQALGINRSTVTQLLLVHYPESRSEAQSALINKIKKIGLNTSLSLTANAKRFNTNVLTIKAVAHDLGLSTPPPNQKGTKDQQILEMRQSGLSYRSIGKQLGISYERVRQILQRCGYQNPPKPPKTTPQPKTFTILKKYNT